MIRVGIIGKTNTPEKHPHLQRCNLQHRRGIYLPLHHKEAETLRQAKCRHYAVLPRIGIHRQTRNSTLHGWLADHTNRVIDLPGLIKGGI